MSNNQTELLKQIHNARQKLETIAHNLKQHFIGIDNVIDSIIENITVWYTLPSLLGRPVIVNLWGLTGVGKTDLVRKLVKELGMSSQFLEIQLAAKGQGYNKTIQDVLESSNIQSDQPGILLLDEVQRYRTINESGNEIRDNDFQDVWMLLSDGNFAGSGNTRRYIQEMIYNDMYNVDYYAAKRKLDKNAPTNEEEEDNEGNPDLFRLRKFKQDHYNAQRLKRSLNLSESIEEIMTWDSEQRRSVMKKSMSEENTYAGASYKQLLIFVSGNLDEAFFMSDQTEEADTNADTIHASALRINAVTIKEALRKRFKPEQISRMGNIHIVYPSLDKSAYEKIIQNRVNDLLHKLETYGIKIKLHQNVYECIYRNGVFPAQGVRPVLSTITGILGNALPEFLMHAIEHNQKSLFVNCEGEFLYTEIKGKRFDKKIECPLDRVRKNHDPLLSAIAAVHEAGHAVLYTVLFKTAPIQMTINLAHAERPGWVDMHKIRLTKNLLIQKVCALLGGLAAEEMVFGSMNRSYGCIQDLSEATRHLVEAYRHAGIGKYLGRRTCPTVDDPFIANKDEYEQYERIEVERILDNEKQNAFDILNNYKHFFMEIVDELLSERQIPIEKYQNMAEKYGLTADILPLSAEVSLDYPALYKQFCDENPKINTKNRKALKTPQE